MKVKLLTSILLVALAFGLTIQTVAAAEIVGSITASSSEIITHGTVTVTCSYTSSTSSTGTGYLSLSGPYADKDDPDAFNSWSVIYSWDGVTGRPLTHGPVLTSGVPVTYTKTLDTPGYYKFKWECGSSDGAYTWVIVHVVDTPTVLPEAPPLAVYALGFAAIGLFAVVTKKRTRQ